MTLPHIYAYDVGQMVSRTQAWIWHHLIRVTFPNPSTLIPLVPSNPLELKLDWAQEQI